MKNFINFIKENAYEIWVVLAVIATMILMVLIIVDGTETRTITMRVCHIEKSIVLLETSDGEVYTFVNEGDLEYKINDICTVKLDLHKIKDNTDDTIVSIVNNGSLEEWGN